MKRIPLAAALIVGLVVAGCATATPTPSVGTIWSCGPSLETAQCRRIAQAALDAYTASPLIGDHVDVTPWTSCHEAGVVGVSKEAAASGVSCYDVFAVGNVGGQRMSEATYHGGRPVNILGLVWSDAQGTLHAVTTLSP